MLTINDLPRSERPRERLLHHGAAALSSAELLVLILGRGIKGEPVMIAAQKLLSTYGSLHQLAEASTQDIRALRGFGLAKACQLVACFEIARRINILQAKQTETASTPGDIHTLVKNKIANFRKEHFVVISLDTRNRLVAVDVVFVGTLNASLVHPREVFDVAIRRHAASIIVSHNHPSGDPEPSEADEEITKKLWAAGRLMGIELVDHVIITKDTFYSFKAHGLLNFNSFERMVKDV